jgi:hypothetical protein
MAWYNSEGQIQSNLITTFDLTIRDESLESGDVVHVCDQAEISKIAGASDQSVSFSTDANVETSYGGFYTELMELEFDDAHDDLGCKITYDLYALDTNHADSADYAWVKWEVLYEKI